MATESRIPMTDIRVNLEPIGETHDQTMTDEVCRVLGYMKVQRHGIGEILRIREALKSSSYDQDEYIMQLC